MKQIVGVMLVAGCWGCGGAAAVDAAQAKDAFWEAFGSGDAAGIPAAREQMISVSAANPGDPELRRLIGMSLLYAVGGPPDAQGAVAWLEKAVAIDSGPHESGFLAGTLYGMGSFKRDAAMAQRGRELLEPVIRELPAFGLLTRADVMRGSPHDSEDFATSLESYFRFFEVCTGASIDRAKPDLTPVLARPFKEAEVFCGNSPHVPHGLQGTLLTLGDALVKNGQPEAARPVYEVIPRTEGYDSWTYGGLLEERLAADLSERVALHRTADPRQGQRVGAGCLACHQR